MLRINYYFSENHRFMCTCQYIVVATIVFLSCDTSRDKGTTQINTTEQTQKSLARLISFQSIKLDSAFFIGMMDSLMYGAKSIDFLSVQKLNDSVSYTLFTLSDQQTCTYTFLGVQKGRRLLSVDTIAVNCDDDMSQPSYTYSDFSYDSLKHSIQTTIVSESAKPQFLEKVGQVITIKDGYTRETTQNRIDSSIIVRKLKSNGTIEVERKKIR